MRQISHLVRIEFKGNLHIMRNSCSSIRSVFSVSPCIFRKLQPSNDADDTAYSITLKNQINKNKYLYFILKADPCQCNITLL